MAAALDTSLTAADTSSAKAPEAKPSVRPTPPAHVVLPGLVLALVLSSLFGRSATAGTAGPAVRGPVAGPLNWDAGHHLSIAEHGHRSSLTRLSSQGRPAPPAAWRVRGHPQRRHRSLVDRRGTPVRLEPRLGVPRLRLGGVSLGCLHGVEPPLRPRPALVAGRAPGGLGERGHPPGGRGRRHGGGWHHPGGARRATRGAGHRLRDPGRVGPDLVHALFPDRGSGTRWSSRRRRQPSGRTT
jgi:hypothetical protein